MALPVTPPADDPDIRQFEVRAVYRVAQLVVGFAMAAAWLGGTGGRGALPTDVALGLLWAAFAVAFALNGWWRLLKPKPLLTLARDGLSYRPLGAQQVPWRAVRGVRDPKTVLGSVRLKLSPEFVGKLRLRGDEVVLPAWLLGVNSAEFAVLVGRYVTAARRSE